MQQNQADFKFAMEKIEELMRDEKLRERCKQLSETPDFQKDLQMCEKIAQLDIKGIRINKDLIYSQPENHYTDEEFQRGIFDFFKTIDSLSPEGESLEKIVADNMEYIEVVVNKQGYRSFCSVDSSTKERLVGVNVEGRVGDISTAIHEFTHSISDDFRRFKRKKDWRMMELMPVISDQLSPIILSKIFPRFRENFAEARLESQVINVMKARKSVVEGMFVKMMAGEVGMEELLTTYNNLFGGNMKVAQEIFEAVQNRKFDAMFEARYLLPQAAAIEMAERFEKNPQEVAKLFKNTLLSDGRISLEEGLTNLKLPNEENLIEEYIQKFPARIEKFQSNEFATEV